jgi:hypothetical protein
MLGNIFAGITILASVVAILECGTKYNELGLFGWLVALVWSSLFLIRDLIVSISIEDQRREDRAVEAYNKLLNAADNSKDLS